MVGRRIILFILSPKLSEIELRSLRYYANRLLQYICRQTGEREHRRATKRWLPDTFVDVKVRSRTFDVNIRSLSVQQCD